MLLDQSIILCTSTHQIILKHSRRGAIFFYACKPIYEEILFLTTLLQYAQTFIFSVSIQLILQN